MNRPARRVLTLAAGAVMAVGLTACSTSDVPKADVEDQISTQLEEEVGQAPDDVTCPEDLKSEEGETMECTLTAGEDEYGVTVEVTSVDGGDVAFDITVDDQPK